MTTDPAGPQDNISIPAEDVEQAPNTPAQVDIDAGDGQQGTVSEAPGDPADGSEDGGGIPEPGSVSDPAHGVPGDAEPLPDGDADEEVEESGDEDPDDVNDDSDDEDDGTADSNG